jgi:hypothetical protein
LKVDKAQALSTFFISCKRAEQNIIFNFQPKLMKKILPALSVLILFSCNNKPASKLYIVSNGTLLPTSSANEIQIKPGTSFLEKEYELNSDETKLRAVIGRDEQTGALYGTGYYLWNLKKDTLVGAKQTTGSAARGTVNISQEMLKTKIDSLVALTENKNVSPANRNYFVLPNQVVRISEGTNVYIAGPFHSLPRQLDETKYNASTEVFKFYTVKELREEIERLKAMTK